MEAVPDRWDLDLPFLHKCIVYMFRCCTWALSHHNGRVPTSPCLTAPGSTIISLCERGWTLFARQKTFLSLCLHETVFPGSEWYLRGWRCTTVSVFGPPTVKARWKIHHEKSFQFLLIQQYTTFEGDLNGYLYTQFSFIMLVLVIFFGGCQKLLYAGKNPGNKKCWSNYSIYRRIINNNSKIIWFITLFSLHAWFLVSP